MTFVHNNTTFEVLELTYTNKKGIYVSQWTYSGKIKAIQFDNMEENLAPVDGDVYKLTYKGILNINGSAKIRINEGVYIWDYTVKTYKVYTGILFTTTKLLLVKE